MPGQLSGRCFHTHPQTHHSVVHHPIILADNAALALATLIPILGCGEEAATLAFAALGRNTTLSHVDRAQLHQIAKDEIVHDALIDGLRRTLPLVVMSPATSSTTRRFHMSLRGGGVDLHLARIAALDAGVCTILSRLLSPKSALRRTPAVAEILGRIRHDESRHVGVSRRIALARCPLPALRDAAAAARLGLADIIAREADAFEQLGVDAGALTRDLARLPDGLLT